MKYNLEREVLANYDPKYKNLYKWCINERINDAEKPSTDYVNWDWHCYFHCSSIKVLRKLEISRADENSPKSTKQVTRIIGIAHSGFHRHDYDFIEEIYYSMFGTNRKIEKFGVTIYESENGKEDCYVSAIPSYDIELDGDSEVAEDFVSFDLYLNKEKFREYVTLIDEGKVDNVYFVLKEAKGFYAQWSPNGSTFSIKLLTPSHELIGVDETIYKPSIISDIGEFEIYFGHSQTLKTKSKSDHIEVESHQERELNDEDFHNPNRYSEQNYYLLNNLVEDVRALTSKLKAPLWCIFAVLLLILLK
jgi:hypothetical protein